MPGFSEKVMYMLPKSEDLFLKMGQKICKLCPF